MILARNLTFYFGLVIFALLANNYALYSNLKQLQDHKQWVDHTHAVIKDLDRVESNVRASEAVARGYMMAPTERSFAEEMNRFSTEAWKYVSDLDVQTVDNPKQQENVKILGKLVEQRLAHLRESYREVQVGIHGQKITDMLVEGREIMGSLRRQLAAMEAEEQRLLVERTKHVEQSQALVYWTFLISALVNMLLISIAFWLFKRHLSQQEINSEVQAHKAWVQDRLLRVAKIFAVQLTPKHVAEETLKFFTEDLNFPAANFFVASEGYLNRVATIAGPLTPSENTRYNFDEGLVGAAASRGDIYEISEIPKGYFRIESSMGSTEPSRLIFIPIDFQETLLGVVEIASFHELNDKQRELMPMIQERLATILGAAIARERQQDLLEETQRQGEELQAQQEELRTNNEELEEQASALLRAQERQQTQQEELRQINEELEAQARTLEHQQDQVNARNDELEAARRESEMRAVELERTNQYKSEFLAKMSHELRTPLNSMLILSALLGEDKDRNLTKQQIEFARTIHDAGADLLNLINDILDLSKLEAGKLQLDPEPFALKSHLETMEAQFRPIMDKRGIGFRIEMGANLPQVLNQDRQRLEQILRNLLSNAAKFTEKGEVRLDVQLSSDPSRLRFAVHDSGIGIPADKKQRIFEAFEQVDGSISRRFGGTGLGLTISRELAALLKGSLSLDSQENVGSTFVIEVPINVTSSAEATAVKTASAPIAAAGPTTVTAPARVLGVNSLSTSAVETSTVKPKDIGPLLEAMKYSTRGRSLLIVEDDPGFTKALEESARTHGFDPVVCHEGETALEFLKQHTPSAILLDVKLPGLSGMGVLENIKQNSKLRHVPIHMISGMDYQVPAMRLGAIGYLGKPVSLEGVKGAFERIERMLDKQVKQVLVIEDDETQAKAMHELLKGPGIEITTVHSAKEALDKIANAEYECVIVDLTLPDLSGLELLEKVHSALGEKVPPIIVYTGRDLSRDEEEKLRAFSESIIIKGAKSPERLLDEVNLFLHRVESELPEDQRSMLSELRMRERGFEGRKVLLVDDDLRNIFALTSALESKGLKVHAARNGFEALEALEKHPDVDAVLMDIMMPKMDGYEAIRRIRENPEFKELPIIALTAKAMKGDHEKCLQAGANDYLPKPVNMMNLISVLKVWLTSKKVWL